MLKEFDKFINESIDNEINFFLLHEGRGMSFRKAGDVFANQEKELTFVKALMLPPNKSSYSTKEETEKAIENVVKNNKISIEKAVNNSNKAAMIVILKDNKTKKLIGFLKYFSLMTPDGKGKWSEKEFGTETGYSRESSETALTTSALENIPIKPSDLIGDDKERNIKELYLTCLSTAKEYVTTNKLPPDVLKHITLLFESILHKKESPILKGGGKYASAYNKYLGEILAPASLVTGWLCVGDRDESEKVLFSGKKYSNARIAFNTNPNEKLIDSKIVDASGTNVGISSKAASGAAATITTFNDILLNLKERNLKSYNLFAKKYSSIISMVTNISLKNWFDGPVELATDMGLLSKIDIDILNKLKQNIHMDLNYFKKNIKLTKNLFAMTSIFKGITPYDLKTKEPGYEPVYHVISGIAKTVAAKINADETFNKGIRELLSFSNMVQINSNIKLLGPSNEDCKFVNFSVKYPPTFKGRIIVDASKNYSATRIRGKISFKMI